MDSTAARAQVTIRRYNGLTVCDVVVGVRGHQMVRALPECPS